MELEKILNQYLREAYKTLNVFPIKSEYLNPETSKSQTIKKSSNIEFRRIPYDLPSVFRIINSQCGDRSDINKAKQNNVMLVISTNDRTDGLIDRCGDLSQISIKTPIFGKEDRIQHLN